MKWIVVLLVLTAGMFGIAHMYLKRDVAHVSQARSFEYPVLGLVLPEGGSPMFEPVAQNLEVLQQAAHLQILRKHGCKRVTHLVLHLDCHYYFADNAMVYVTTWASPGRPPRLVETRSWAGPPAEFDGYHTELLPEA
ncbi:hypothetical protein DES53_109238 [Roseimicrobium gellanilyticum]|uniref:Uncharacterized protein n=1 Tax=Roseimicrobium gellanilyticum TaxID=748857 RepID=A0A366HCV5_9BACT|nr:hypothetical protein [Roseimicrobium gellanilyticum]RBP39810.1 hypothetical protein DES53_109238 [Roseimicrobium gellanilyticum]